MTTTCIVWWLLLPLAVAVAVVYWATESRHTRVRRLRSYGWTWQRIASRYSVSPTTVRRWAAA